MPASPAPAYVRINYHSAYGQHTMQVPTLAWSSNQFTTWASGSVTDSKMIDDLVALLLPFYPSTVTFDNWIVFSQPTPTDAPVPVNASTFTGMDGTAGSPGWTKAVQLTMSVRSTNFGVAKYVFLDGASGNNFDPIRVADSAMLAVLAEVADTSNGWSAQDNGRPDTFIGLTKTMNEKLRKAYRMV